MAVEVEEAARVLLVDHHAGGIRLVAEGRIESESELRDVIRVDETGSPDESFGRRGVASITTEYGDPLPTISSTPRVGLDDSGRTLVYHAVAEPDAGDDLRTRVLVSRLTQDGDMDAEFGEGGTFALPTEVDATSLVPLPGELLVDGDGAIDSVSSLPEDPMADLVGYVARVSEDGTLDEEFGRDGYAARSGEPYLADVRGPSTLGDDIVTRVGHSLQRIDADGSLDESFGDGGEIELPSLKDDNPIFAHQHQLDEDSFVIASGPIGATGGVVSLVSSDGSITKEVELDPDTHGTCASLMRFSADGIYLVCFGVPGDDLESEPSTNVLRLDSDLRFDTSWGDEGVLTIPFGPATAIEIHGDDVHLGAVHGEHVFEAEIEKITSGKLTSPAAEGE